MHIDSPELRHLDTDLLLGTIPSGLFVVDLEMRIVSWNRAAERITGFSAAEAVGQHCSFLQGIPCGERCGLYDPAVRKPLVGGLCTITGKDGRNIRIMKNIDFLRDSEGRVIGGIESFVDITRQQQLEADLRRQAEELEHRVAERTQELIRSETRLRAVLDTMDDPAYCTNGDFRITMANRATRDLYGDCVGEICHRLFRGIDHPCDWCCMERVLGGATVREERQIGVKGGLYEMLHMPLSAGDGTIQKLAVCRDITERKKTERQLLEANRELDAFAHSISHDLRSLLAPVVTYMDYLQTQHGDAFDPQIRQVLAEVEQQAERAIMLLDDLLDLAQVGHVAQTGVSADISGLVAEIVRELPADETTERPAVVVGDLPPMPLPESLAYQVVANLVGNALSYAGRHGGPVEVGCREESGRLVYFVRDHGPGVDPAEREQIFEIFHRGTAARHTRGTGVGLAIVRKIALHYHGSVWVEETPGGGATFCFALPAQPG